MPQTEYEYHGLMAELWDLFRGDTSTWSDRFFYREIVRKYGGPVLDVGCGTGRILLEFLSDGVDIDGMDNSPEMLELCREKAEPMGLHPALYCQEMATLDLPRRYQTLLVPSSSFQLLLDPSEAKGAFRCFYEHLMPGGVLVMPFMLSWREGEPTDTGWRATGEAVRPGDGSLARRWSREWFDPAAQFEHTETKYEISKDGQMLATEHHRRSPAVRWYTQDQAVSLYREAGFEEIQVLKVFTFEPASEENMLFSIIGRRPETPTL